MKIANEVTGEILVMRDPFLSCVEVRIKGMGTDEDRIVRLSRPEARRLAALILFQAERLEDARARRLARSAEVESKSA